MIVTPIKTHKITSSDTDLFKILDQYVLNLIENSVVAITSKIISICEGSIKKIGSVEKDELIKNESELFLPRSSSKYNLSFAIKNGIMAVSAGIDESNGNGYYILWPKNPQQSANKIREYLSKKFNIKNLGVIITDSKTTPLRWGVTGIALVHSGFKALCDYIGKPDLFGRPFEYEKLNIADSLAVSAVLVMGEGGEQTPIAKIEDLENVEFLNRNPTDEEINELRINLDEDIYGPFLSSANWQKGGKSV